MSVRRSVALVLGLTMCSASLADMQCDDILAELQHAESRRDLARMQRAYAVASQTDCEVGDPPQRLFDVAGAVLGRMQFEAIDSGSLEQPEGRRQAIQRLLEVAALGMPWEGYELLGDLLQREQRFDEAAEQYQRGLMVAADTKLTPQDVPHSRVAALLRKGEQARLLAKNYVAASTTRDGYAAQAIRGLEVEQHVLPLEFVHDSVRLTEKGEQCLKDLVRVLSVDSSGETVRLVGHTDQTGSDVYNDALSLRRVESVAQRLRHAGIKMQITTEGRGERELLRIVNTEKYRYTPAQIDQLNRRVEWVRPNGQ